MMHAPGSFSTPLWRKLEKQQKDTVAAKERQLREALNRIAELERRIEAISRLKGIPVCSTAKRIMQETAKKHGLTVADLVCPGRTDKLAAARWEAMFLILRDTMLSTPEIGRLFRRDHTTVLHGVSQHALRNGLTLPRWMKIRNQERRPKKQQ